jgi:hypothetical protein
MNFFENSFLFPFPKYILETEQQIGLTKLEDVENRVRINLQKTNMFLFVKSHF